MLYDLWRAACTTESCEEMFKRLVSVYTCIIIGLLSLSLSLVSGVRGTQGLFPSCEWSLGRVLI